MPNNSYRHWFGISVEYPNHWKAVALFNKFTLTERRFFRSGCPAIAEFDACAFDPRGDLDAIPGFFQGSEGNDIPDSAADIPGMSAVFREGSDSGNAQRTSDRVRRLGFGINSGGAGVVAAHLTVMRKAARCPAE